jgi:hypothetical protein
LAYPVQSVQSAQLAVKGQKAILVSQEFKESLVLLEKMAHRDQKGNADFQVLPVLMAQMV